MFNFKARTEVGWLVEKHLEKFPSVLGTFFCLQSTGIPSVLGTFCLQSTGRNFQESLEDMSPRGSFPLLLKGARHF